MVLAVASIVGDSARQSAQLDLSTQGINDPQDVFKSQCGLACIKISARQPPLPEPVGAESIRAACERHEVRRRVLVVIE
jgi:hypothetical protein